MALDDYIPYVIEKLGKKSATLSQKLLFRVKESQQQKSSKHSQGVLLLHLKQNLVSRMLLNTLAILHIQLSHLSWHYLTQLINREQLSMLIQNSMDGPLQSC